MPSEARLPIDTHLGKSPLPNLSAEAELLLHAIRKAAFGESHRLFDGRVGPDGYKKMDVIRTPPGTYEKPCSSEQGFCFFLIVDR